MSYLHDAKSVDPNPQIENFILVNISSILYFKATIQLDFQKCTFVNYIHFVLMRRSYFIIYKCRNTITTCKMMKYHEFE